MISDNYVTGDNIYLRELQNFFFEVLGMMSITHYGARGDGRTDNYGPIQVAIDDANRRNLNYIYVPYGRFIYAGELRNMGNIVFIGNPNAHIVNIRTGEEIEIQQFGTTDQTNIRYYVVDRYYTHTDNNFTDEEKAQVAAYALAASTYMVKGTDYVTAGKKSGTTLGYGATVEGDENEASEAWAHAEGQATKATAQMAHAEGRSTTASGLWSHAQGSGTTASSYSAHAEGRDTIASNTECHAEGFHTTASGERSHAEGQITTASGHYAHSEGAGTVASGLASHAEGRDTTAAGIFQHVQGINNVVDNADEYVDIVGAGFNDSPKNIYTLDWYGNAWFQGDVYVGSNGGVNKDSGSKKLATEVYVMQQIAQMGSLKIEVVQQLPTHDISTDTIYLLPDPDATQGNAYLEYIYINNAWELIGSTQVDLTNYYTKAEVDALIPTYTAGTNIFIDANNVISAVTAPVATSISSTSTNDEVAGAKAVYDFSPNLPRFAYTLENAVGNKSANAWYDITNEYTTGVIPAGVYLMFHSFHLTSNNSNGVVTGKILLDATEPEPHVRNTVPVSGNGTVAGSGVNIIAFSAAATHTLKFQGWGSTSWSVSASSTNVSQVVFVRIGDYVPTNTLNIPLMNTGSLVGMGDRTELDVTEDSTSTTSESGDTI